MNNKIILILIGVLVLIGATYLYFNKIQSNGTVPTGEQTMCATDVMECADGTFVNRTGPNCEFAACRVDATGTESNASPLKNIVNKELGVAFDYFDNFYLNEKLTDYIRPVDWPPQISVSTSTYTCVPTTQKIADETKIERKTINGKIYCLTTQSEGAAGSTYTTYTYKIPVAKKTVLISFIVRVPQCANYDEVKRMACENEKKDFSIDQMVDQIFKSIKFI